MYRIKVATTIAVMLLFVLILSATLFWGAQRTGYYFQRSKLAYELLESYQQLSVDTDRFFHEQLSIIALAPKARAPADTQAYSRAKNTLDKLKRITLSKTDHSETDHSNHPSREALSRIDKLELLITEGEYITNLAHQLKREGEEQQAHELMELVFFHIINKQIWPLIDIAVAEEEKEALEASQAEHATIENLRRATITIALIATLVAIIIAILLYRRLTEPLNQLLEGTQSIAAGDLGHRLNIINEDEFGHLARQFNSMADALQHQQTELLNSRATLENVVEERTLELKRANQQLRNIDESRRQFFADISHELRTPLTIIRGEAEVTLRGGEKSSQEYSTALQRINELTTQMGKLVEDLLYLARANTVALQYQPDEVALNKLMSECHQDAQSLAQKKQLTIHLNASNIETPVTGDRVRLKQLLHILIDNACHYSQQHGNIDLRLKANKHNAIISVHDHGIGIPQDELERVFERFYRSKEARILSTHGTGLGLSLAKAIVETHHGSIELTSQQGKGTTVTVTLPLTTSHTP